MQEEVQEEEHFDDFDLDDSSFEDQTLSRRCSKRFQKYMILPNNPKLQKFHYLASISLLVDFFMSGFIIGNYEFQIGQIDHNFMNQDDIFFILIIV